MRYSSRHRPGRRRPLLMGVVGVRGDLAAVLGEHPADRLDPETPPVSVDEGDYLCDWRSSSAPKKVAAAFKISFARRSSLILTLELLDLGPLVGGQPGPVAGVGLGPAHPLAQRLVIHAAASPRSTRSPSTASGTRAGGQTPSAPPAPGTPPGYGGRRASSCLTLLHPLKGGAVTDPGAIQYGEHRPYGYVFGGSGGAYRTVACIENGHDVWDGAVPYHPRDHDDHAQHVLGAGPRLPRAAGQASPNRRRRRARWQRRHVRRVERGGARTRWPR